jgi:hypothetical protein
VHLTPMKTTEAKLSAIASKSALSDLSETGVKEISTDLRKLLADVFALYVKTKKEFSLAHDWSELPRLSPPVG